MPSSVASPSSRPEPASALPPLVVICGATATGKSRLAIGLAEHLGGMEVIGADSRQVYRGMDVGTDKVSTAIRASVPHHGLDLVDPDEPFSVADFQAHAHDALAGIASRGRAAILVGGSGLYLRVVARGVPVRWTGTDPALRITLEARLGTDGLSSLASELCRVAPETARITDLANPRRVIRALERVAIGGDRPPPAPVGYPAPVAWLGLRMEPPEHRAAIARRVARQFAGGLLDEASELRERFGPEPTAFSAVGYREAFSVLDGQTTIEQAIDTTNARTWQYARRQGTWFRSEPDVTWLDAAEPSPDGAAAEAVERLFRSAVG